MTLTLCYSWHDHRGRGGHHSCHRDGIRHRRRCGAAAAIAATADQRGLRSSYHHGRLLGGGGNDWRWDKLSDCSIVMGLGEDVGHEGWTWWCGHYNHLGKGKEVIFMFLLFHYCSQTQISYIQFKNSVWNMKKQFNKMNTQLKIYESFPLVLLINIHLKATTFTKQILFKTSFNAV